MSNNKNVLLVSPYPYSISSRGMDVLTNCFEEENWNVDHLTYPVAFFTPKVKAPADSKVNMITSKSSKFPYIDRIMFWFPSFIFNIVKKINNRTIKGLNFTKYDYVVLESGKALFLMDIIPKNIPIIYRLSDSVEFVLGKNRTYKALEKTVFEKSHKMIFKKEVYKNFLTQDQKDKTTVIENGMVIPKKISVSSSLDKNSKNAVYVGLHQLDFKTVQALVSECPECNFHIIGPCLGKKQIQKLNSFSNFHYYAFLSKEEYMPIIKDCDFAIFPFKRTEAMKWFGLTSKLLHFMYFKLPIVLYPTGVEGEFDGMSVKFAQSIPEFVQCVKTIISDDKKIDYNIDFEYYSGDSRKIEYKSFIKCLK